MANKAQTNAFNLIFGSLVAIGGIAIIFGKVGLGSTLAGIGFLANTIKTWLIK
ncbi:MAG: hypothetical protein AABY22_13730 [Nanoarchaeota archaeon]